MLRSEIAWASMTIKQTPPLQDDSPMTITPWKNPRLALLVELALAESPSAPRCIGKKTTHIPRSIRRLVEIQPPKVLRESDPCARSFWHGLHSNVSDSPYSVHSDMGLNNIVSLYKEGMSTSDSSGENHPLGKRSIFGFSASASVAGHVNQLAQPHGTVPSSWNDSSGSSQSVIAVGCVTTLGLIRS